MVRRPLPGAAVPVLLDRAGFSYGTAGGRAPATRARASSTRWN